MDVGTLIRPVLLDGRTIALGALIDIRPVAGPFLTNLRIGAAAAVENRRAQRLRDGRFVAVADLLDDGRGATV